jgi:hypothetical protein
MSAMKPHTEDISGSPTRYRSLEQPKVPLWAVVGIIVALIAVAVVIIRHV